MPSDRRPPDRAFLAAAMQAAYDLVADDYTAVFGHDLDQLPLDRTMLDKVIDRLRLGALVLDLGCGPAPVSAYLTNHGVSPIGADLSAGMLQAATTRVPSVPLVQADMRRLPFRAGAFGAVIAYYSIQHLGRAELSSVLNEVAWVLAYGGIFLVATHLGEGEAYLAEFLGHRIEPIGGSLYRPDELVARVEEAGLAVEDERRRGPLEHEADTERIYLLACRTQT